MFQQKRSSHRKLSAEDEKYVLDILNSERLCDMTQGEIYAILLDEGVYLCSEQTMYHILERNSQNQQRRQSAPKNYTKPELLATKPNELLVLGYHKVKRACEMDLLLYLQNYCVFSRYVVGWAVAFKESAQLAEKLIGNLFKTGNHCGLIDNSCR